MTIADAIAKFKADCGQNVRLVAVSKYSPDEAVQAAYAAGQLDFGENKAQDVKERAAAMPADIRWHFIGHLQRNKVKYIAPFVHLIHSIDSVRLLEEVEKQAAQAERTISCLLQLHISGEASKFGFSYDELSEVLSDTDWSSFRHVKIVGLMGMASLTDDESLIRAEFRGLKKYFDQIKNQALPALFDFTELSMGMSSDYRIAVEEGSTMIRVGSAIFNPE